VPVRHSRKSDASIRSCALARQPIVLPCHKSQMTSLSQHAHTHRPRTEECYGCDEFFFSHADIINHLKTSTYVLGLASPVFQTMFTGNFEDGREVETPTPTSSTIWKPAYVRRAWTFGRYKA